MTLITSVPSEQVFSVAGGIVSKKRNRLEADTIQLLMLTKAWLGLVEFKKDEYAEELLGEEANYEADSESAAGSEDGKDFIMQ